MYPLLKKGDRLPSVAMTQILINRRMRKGSYIAVDGIFGRKTEGALRDFQIETRQGRTGKVDADTWRELTKGEQIHVIDAVDITEIDELEHKDIRSAGGDPLVSYGMCNGVKVTMMRIQSLAEQGKIGLLRFHGHGAPGVMGISSGVSAEASSEFGVQFLSGLARYLERFRHIFSSIGSVELHGCRVGAGRNGRKLVRALARVWGVPVSAGVRSQYAGGRSTFRFEGPTITAIPGGGTLVDWAKSLPVAEVHGMSVNR